MQTQQTKRQPVEFVTLATDGKMKRNKFTNNDNYTHASTTASHDRFSELPSGEGFISQLTVFDPNDDDEFVSASRSVTQPSITCTYDSDTDDDDDDDDDDDSAASFDLIAHMISNDEPTVDDVQSVTDEQSINSDTRTENQSTIEYLTSAANTITRKCLERNRMLSCTFSFDSMQSIFSSTSVPSTPDTSTPDTSTPVSSTPVPLRSDRLSEMKNRLRSLEIHYKEQKIAPHTESSTPTFHVDKSIDLKDSIICCIDDSPASPIRRKSKSAGLKKSVLESAGEIITINLILGLLYLIYVLSKDALAMIMQDVNEANTSFRAL
eukprot:CAMPEP_0198250084 /NCGR_PEP_ID=MMETSP1447-20131203/1401_1 /TAXON_ID=420782 /ORGANISM="Chaetoceros dichaeta, Strain CCMP1751" /LENGTH=321 /DNA_ID=CAMNT_0043934861 /DNA_START=53 /DNA_END=1018 /DNA_ORIENTATION=+